MKDEEKMDKSKKRKYEKWGIRKKKSEDNVKKEMKENIKDGNK